MTDFYGNKRKAYQDVAEILRKGKERGYDMEQMRRMALQHCAKNYGFGERFVDSQIKIITGN